MATIHPRIFRAYDIRGLAYEQLTAESCALIGQAFGSELQERYSLEHPRVCVGRDARIHSAEFERAVIAGLLRAGCAVVEIGQHPSPVNYFTICEQSLDGGIHVTASHNPPDDNGLKLSTREAEAFAGEDLQQLRRRIEEDRFASGEGARTAFDAAPAYLSTMHRIFGAAGKGLTVVVDAGNGVAGPLSCEVLRAAGARVIELYTEPDGRFPNHLADPSKHDTLVDLQRMVVKEEADLGLAFDGDGDRLGLVDEQGAIRSADEILLLLAKDHLSRFPGSPVVFTVSNSGILDSEIRGFGGNPVLCKVGHSFVEHAMRECGSKLGGEQSGHFFCAEDYYAFDDALVAALRVLSILTTSDARLSDLFAAFPKVYQAPERRPYCPDEHKTRIVEEVTIHFSRSYPVLTLDGVRIDFGEGAWAGIRQSNTAPRISICIEARDPATLREIEELVLSHLGQYPELRFEE